MPYREKQKDFGDEIFLEDTDAPLPETLNQKTRYAFFSEVAKGGKSVILSCQDLHLRRTVCYKTLRSEFQKDPIENKLLSAYDVGGAKGFKSEFYRKIYAYKFFMVKRATNETFKPIELVNFIHDQQEKRFQAENPPISKRTYNPRNKKLTFDPAQMTFNFT